MTVRVGVIGAGVIGRDHVRRITEVLSGAEVVAVADADPDVAHQVAARLRSATVYASGRELIAHDDVDAILVASSGPTHEEYVIASVAAGKPVFCEKPLATTEHACRNIIEAETAAGRRLIQVGFMRRYDPAYRALKRTIDDGAIGDPLIYYSAHRSSAVPETWTDDMAIIDAAPHDFDIARWLLGVEFATIQVFGGKPNRFAHGLRDPLFMTLQTTNGTLVNVETSLSIGYGYDIRGEAVGERGTASLADAGRVVIRSENRAGVGIPKDWRERFATAYDVELQEWIDAVECGQGARGPSSWDGYVAQVVSEAGIRALHTGERVPVELIERPAVYGAPEPARSRT